MTEVLSEDLIEQLLTNNISKKNKLKSRLFTFVGYFKKRYRILIQDVYFSEYSEYKEEFSVSDFGEEFNFREKIFFDDFDSNSSFENHIPKEIVEEFEETPMDNRGPWIQMTLGSTEFVASSLCPFCSRKHDGLINHVNDNNSIPDYRFLNTDREMKRKKTKKFPLKSDTRFSCENCRKRFTPENIIKREKGSTAQYSREETITELEKWNHYELKRSIPFFSVKGFTLKTEKGQVKLFWNRFLSDEIQGFKYCPNDILYHIIKYTPKKDLRRMLKGEKDIPVFGGYDFDKYFKLKH